MITTLLLRVKEDGGSTTAQIHEIPVIVKNLSNQEVIEIAIIENVQRSELKPLEEADGYLD